MRRRQAHHAPAPSTTAQPASESSTEALGTRFKMRQRIFAIGDDFWIENDQGERVFKVDGKAIRVRDTLIFEDMQGHELYKIQERMARVRDTMNIEDASGHAAARVHNAMVTPVRDRWRIDIPGGHNLVTMGNIFHHEYRILRDRSPVAQISRKYFRVSDTYGVDAAPNEDAALLLAITVVVDMMAHEGR